MASTSVERPLARLTSADVESAADGRRFKAVKSFAPVALDPHRKP
ncbi:hypothetical protein [Kitasatospora sp. NPDC050543]